MQTGRLIAVLFFVFVLSCCSDHEKEREIASYKVAIVMPQERQDEWSRIADWALNNIKEAQTGLDKEVQLNIEWHDEDSPDLSTFIRKVANDDSYSAIIGPYSSLHAHTTAEICAKTDKTLILPIATSAEVQRMYAGKNNIWNLTQSDISQCELMLAQAVISESTEVSLLTTDDDYGRSFSDWFAYQAFELGLKVKDIHICSSADDVRSAVNSIFEGYGYRQHLLVALSQENLALAFDTEVNRLKKGVEQFRFPYVICSDVMNSPTLAKKLTALHYEGVSPCAAPVSGFAEAHRVKFGMEPANGAAHLYDALILLSYALTINDGDLNKAILDAVEGRDSWTRSWLTADMHDTFAQLQSGARPDLSGVTGDWTFDDRHHSGVLNTTYAHWALRNGTYLTLEYLSCDGSSRTTSSLQAWDVQSQVYQEFSTSQQTLAYPEYSGENWAVVIGTSDTWVNYRHQADALAMYQLLKRHGYEDDHIILIIADNIAYDQHNIYPGIVRITPDGENVYENAKIDYKLNDVRINDLKRIMSGNGESGSVLSTDEHDNIVVFWCGHGYKNYFDWGEYNVVYSWQIKSLLDTMQGKYRKMLWVMDTCYSGSVGETCTGIPGVLFITSANAYEPSKADVKDPEMGIWLSNGFTREFQETVDAKPDISLRDLYYELARNTVGSHATVYNVENYGNMYKETMSEYF